MFEIQEHHRSGEISIDSITVMEELVQVWEYAGYGDIFQDIYSIKRNISTLYGSCNKLMKIPLFRLELSNDVLTSVIAAVTNHGSGGRYKAALLLKVNSTLQQSISEIRASSTDKNRLYL